MHNPNPDTMADDSVEWITRHIQKGQNLYVEGEGLRTRENAGAWVAHQQRWWQEGWDGIAARSPSHLAKLETLGRFHPLVLPEWHLWWEPPVFVDIAVSSTGEGSPGNNPLSRHAACIERLQDIERDWRADPPDPPSAAAARGRPGHDKPLKVRRIDWWHQMRDELRKHPLRTKKDVAKEIAAREGETPEYIYREASRARTGR